VSLSVKGCWRKVKYGTREAAERGCADSAAAYGKPFRVYPCRDRSGEHYHITSQPKRGRAA